MGATRSRELPDPDRTGSPRPWPLAVEARAVASRLGIPGRWPIGRTRSSGWPAGVSPSDEPWRPLTAREFAVARLVSEGLTNAEIADSTRDRAEDREQPRRAHPGQAGRVSASRDRDLGQQRGSEPGPALRPRPRGTIRPRPEASMMRPGATQPGAHATATTSHAPHGPARATGRARSSGRCRSSAGQPARARRRLSAASRWRSFP